MKKIIATVGAALTAVTLGAQEVSENPAEATEEADSTPIFEVGFDSDLLSAYTWRNSIIDDRMVWQPCVWADLTLLDPFWIGFNIWQNWDLTKRLADVQPRAMNETDYNIHIGATAWTSEDENYSLDVELGMEWFTYRMNSGCSTPSANEIYLRAKFHTPFVNVYGQWSEAYHPVTACHFEFGLDQTWEVGKALELGEAFDPLTAGLDWNMNFGSGKYFTEYLYFCGTDWSDEDGDWSNRLGNGIGGTTLKGNLSYALCDNVSLGLVLAYTAILNQDARDGIGMGGSGSSYKNLLWGGFQVKVSF